MGVMRILDSSGDTEVLWDVSDDEALAKAASLFDELASEGKLAFERNEPQTAASRVQRVQSAARTRSSGCVPSRADDLPSLQPVEELPGSGLLVEVVGGGHDGELLVLVSERRGSGCRRAADLFGPCEISDEVRVTLALVERERRGPSRDTASGVARGPGRRPRDSPAVGPVHVDEPDRGTLAARVAPRREPARLVARPRPFRGAASPTGRSSSAISTTCAIAGTTAREFALCVVPLCASVASARRHLDQSPARTAQPTLTRFFRVANYREFGSGDGLRPGPVPRR